jgi:formylglycine-generating enzyme required for sulfatase activity
MAVNFTPAIVCLLGALFFPRATIALGGHANDQIDMTRVPAGPFSMGSQDGPEDERPQHLVDVAAFSIDRTKVTNSQFAEFLNAVGPVGSNGKVYFDVDDSDARVHRLGGKWQADRGFENNPVVEASWYGALAYCQWRGKNLPTEAQWEKAARGTDGRKFPWGNELPDSARAHFNGGWTDFRPVGSFANGASPFGLLDAAGNGWEVGKQRLPAISLQFQRRTGRFDARSSPRHKRRRARLTRR